MRLGLIFLLLIGIDLSLYAQCEANELVYINQPPCPEDAYKLVFHDEFDGAYLDTFIWARKGEAPAPFDRTLWQGCKREHQAYIEDNAYLSGGNLILEAKREDYRHEGIFAGPDPATCEDGTVTLFEPGERFDETFRFTSGFLTSYGVFAAQPKEHFIMEVRCKIPKGRGLWPAFWMWNFDEIDVFEFFNTEESHKFQVSYVDKRQRRCPRRIRTNIDFSSGFYTFSVEVTDWVLNYYYGSTPLPHENGTLVYSAYKYYNALSNTGLDLCGSVSPTEPYYINALFPDRDAWFRPIVNLAINHGFPENQISGLPAKFEVDYIRVYKRLPEGHDADLCSVKITGERTLCDEETKTYQLSGRLLESGTPIGWEFSDNLSVLGMDSVSLEIAAQGERGTAWIKAIKPDYCPEGIYTFDLDIAFPKPEAKIGRTALPLLDVNPLSEQDNRTVMQNGRITGWQRVAGNGAVQRVSPDGRTFHVYFPMESGGFLKARIEGEMDTGCSFSKEYIFVQYGKLYAISPNPANDWLKVTVNEPPSAWSDFIGYEAMAAEFQVGAQLRSLTVVEAHTGRMLAAIPVGPQNRFDYTLNLAAMGLLPGSYVLRIESISGIVEVHPFIKLN